MSYGVIYRHQAPISHGIDDKGVHAAGKPYKQTVLQTTSNNLKQ